MAIRIIKEGRVTKFTKTCPNCGCEFEYDASDLQTDYSLCLTTYPEQYNTYVVCPCCKKPIHHGTKFAGDMPYEPLKIWYTNTLENNLYDCDKCPNKPDPTKPMQAGDTSCTWCKKNQPYCTNLEGSNCFSTTEKVTQNDYSHDLSLYINNDALKDFMRNITINDNIETLIIHYKGITYKFNLEKVLNLLADVVEDTTVTNK